MDAEQLIREAARKVSVDPQAAALFECLRPHLLSPDHDVGSMLRACAAMRAKRRRLAKILGPLKTWVTELRMTEAARLVRDTRDTDEAIGRRLGYSTERGFRDAFRRVHGVSPAEMRGQARRPRDPVPPAADAPADKAAQLTARAKHLVGKAVGKAGRRHAEIARSRGLRRWMLDLSDSSRREWAVA